MKSLLRKTFIIFSSRTPVFLVTTCLKIWCWIFFIFSTILYFPSFSCFIIKDFFMKKANNNIQQLYYITNKNAIYFFNFLKGVCNLFFIFLLSIWRINLQFLFRFSTLTHIIFFRKNRQNVKLKHLDFS